MAILNKYRGIGGLVQQQVHKKFKYIQLGNKMSLECWNVDCLRKKDIYCIGSENVASQGMQIKRLLQPPIVYFKAIIIYRQY